MRELMTHSVSETENAARSLAQELRPGDLLAFTGGMGAGKTAFIRGLADGLHVRGEVSSPTMQSSTNIAGIRRFITSTCIASNQKMTYTQPDSTIIWMPAMPFWRLSGARISPIFCPTIPFMLTSFPCRITTEK